MSVWSDVGLAILWGAIACLVWGVAGFVLARLLHRANIVDTLWGIGFVLVAVVELIVLSASGHGDPLRRIVIPILVALWGLRLAYYVGRRSAGKGEDPRYRDLMKEKSGSPSMVVVLYVFAPQTVILFLVSMAVQVGMAERGSMRWIGWLGVVFWVIGLVFESVGDAQMRRFKANPANKGKICDVGLWSYTRHPNYFGDAMVWLGLWVIAADRWPGVLTFFSPIIMGSLLAFGTGKRLLEKSMSKREGWPEYAARTSGFIPLPHLHRAKTA